MDLKIKTYPNLLLGGFNEKYAVVRNEDIKDFENIKEGIDVILRESKTYTFPLCGKNNFIQLKINKLPISETDLNRVKSWINLIVETLAE